MKSEPCAAATAATAAAAVVNSGSGGGGDGGGGGGGGSSSRSTKNENTFSGASSFKAWTPTRADPSYAVIGRWAYPGSTLLTEVELCARRPSGARVQTSVRQR